MEQKRERASGNGRERAARMEQLGSDGHKRGKREREATAKPGAGRNVVSFGGKKAGEVWLEYEVFTLPHDFLLKEINIVSRTGRLRQHEAEQSVEVNVISRGTEQCLEGAPKPVENYKNPRKASLQARNRVT